MNDPCLLYVDDDAWLICMVYVRYDMTHSHELHKNYSIYIFSTVQGAQQTPGDQNALTGINSQDISSLLNLLYNKTVELTCNKFLQLCWRQRVSSPKKEIYQVYLCDELWW